jgi:hypothetical protein
MRLRRRKHAEKLDLDDLISELEDRIRRDFWRMKRWRLVHRTNGVLYSLVLIVGPAILAVGLTTSETPIGKGMLLAIAVVGGLNVAFKPYLHSQKRRGDANSMRRLHDEFRVEIVKSRAKDDVDCSIVYNRFSRIYANIYELRGRELIDATLSLDEQRDVAGRTNKEPLGYKGARGTPREPA